MSSYFRTAILLAGLTALFMGVGFLIGGRTGMLIALAVAIATNVFSYWNSGAMVLSMHGAEEVDERSAPEFYGMVRDLAQRANLPMPKVYIMHEDQPNAFATGRNPENAAVAATTGLLNSLSREEVAGVMAHELAHVKNHDTLIMTVTATLAGAISMLANFAMFFGGSGSGENRNPLGFIGVLVAMIVAPLAAMLVQMAISRTREYSADRLGAEICGNPMWLASALQRLEQGRRIPNPQAEAVPSTAPMFIINPLTGTRMDSLFSTHPATANRVAALQAFAAELGGPATLAPARTASPGVAPSGPWGGGTRGETGRSAWGAPRTSARKRGPWN